ncbi:Brp/Blh family beta-carotene 15,15'-dioxygenase [Halomarina rubra]|uniref:Probable beta-carotene 15,15'-dioxygenase n=1 Tax=Halomarina rubra TaxID=2071873 RepID=A0ABD6AUS9_9EURY|nr:Brp/Blh family beta-carotene 15,15'-dioxygenase [Halomarina rubra]
MTVETASAARRTLRRAVFLPVWLLLVAVAVPFALGLTVPRALLYLPFAASVLVLGLPHGAVDHVTLLRARGTLADAGLRALLTGPARDALARVGLLYLVLGGAYLLGWWVAPAAAFVVFVALTWFHWGQGDLYALVDLVETTHLRTGSQRALAVVVRGGLPMVVPLVGAPVAYRRVATDVVGLFDAGAADALAPAFAPGTRLVVAVGFGALSLATLVLGFVHARRRGGAARVSWRLDAVETTLLWGYFLVVPPVLAVGLYFCLWHSVRHIARLVVLDRPATRALAAGDLRPGVVRFARDAAPLTVGALVVFAALFLAVPTDGSLAALVAVYLVLLAVLTLPHVVVVTLLDREQGLWTPPGVDGPGPAHGSPGR